MDTFKQLPTHGDAVNLIGLTACKLHSLPLAPLTRHLDAVRCMCVCEWHLVFVQAFSGKKGHFDAAEGSTMSVGEVQAVQRSAA
jgi:hypothetical protein